jgi:probable F420-dependent oxidoreductase
MTDSPRRLKVGLFLPAGELFYMGGTPRWDDISSMARDAEGAGFDSVWILDHQLIESDTPGWEGVEHGAWECWSILAAIAAVTDRIQLGPFVSNTLLRNPALTAKMADTLDEISGGRFILGLGAGWHQHEIEAFGFPYDHRASRFEEAVQIIQPLLKTGYVDFKGTYYSARDCELRPRGPRPDGPPILIGTKGERVMRIAAKYADMWNAEWLARPEEADPLLERIDAACAEVGRDPATLERSFGLLVDSPGWVAEDHDDFATIHRLGIKPALAGSAEEIAAGLNAFADRGATHVQIWLGPNTRAGIEALAPVLPLLT